MAALAGSLGLVTACGVSFGTLPRASGSTSSGPAGPSTPPTSTTSTATSTPATLDVSPVDLATGVLPTASVTVKAATGTLVGVTVTDQYGSALAGSVTADGAWVSTARMRPSTAYTITAKATGPDGTASTTTSTFKTLVPAVTATYAMNYSGDTVGVGMPVDIQFDSSVTRRAYQAAIEKAMRITVTPAQVGSWGWLDNRQLMWRPKNYWLPGSVVRVEAPLTGFQTGDTKWIARGMTGGFTVGSATISYVNIATHQMTVTQGGRTLRVIPVSTGRDQMPYITRSGTKVVIEKQPTVQMDAATAGIPKGSPDYYNEKVDLAIRLTWTGEYIHSAPWSVAAQGNTNVSHGCTNISPTNAQWMYDLTKVGDIVVFTGSSRPFLPTEGIGVWQYSYAQWQQQSALR